MQTLQKKSRSNIKIVTLVAGVIILLSVGGLVYAYNQDLLPFKEDSGLHDSDDIQGGQARDINSTDYSGPSDEDTASSQDAKKRGETDNDIGSSSDKDSGSPTNKKEASVGISYANINGDNLEIRAFVNNIIEGTGTCTATISKGSSKVTASSKAFIDTSSSICEPIYIAKDKFSSGTWTLNVSYSSPTATGSSEESVVIP